MPYWLWIVIGVLAALALIVFLMANVDVNTKENAIALLGAILG